MSIMLWIVYFTHWIFVPDPFPPTNRIRFKYALCIGSFLVLVLPALIFRNRLQYACP